MWSVVKKIFLYLYTDFQFIEYTTELRTKNETSETTIRNLYFCCNIFMIPIIVSFFAESFNKPFKAEDLFLS